MTIETRKYAAGTQMTVSYPWGINISAKAICPDGKVRSLKRIAQTADTFFSIPVPPTTSTCAIMIKQFKDSTIPQERTSLPGWIGRDYIIQS